MSSQTFRQYSSQKKKDCEKLKDFFPEYFSGNTDHLDIELSYADHMDEVKLKLEQIFGRKLHWIEVDTFSTNFMKVAFLKIQKEIQEGRLPPPNSIEETIEMDIEVRKIFCELLKVTMIDVYIYRQACIISRSGALLKING